MGQAKSAELDVAVPAADANASLRNIVIVSTTLARLRIVKKMRALPAASGGKTPAVALTAYARTEDRRKALVAGFNMHVPKPVEPAELVAVLASLAAAFPRTH